MTQVEAAHLLGVHVSAVPKMLWRGDLTSRQRPSLRLAAAAALDLSREHELEVGRVGWDDKQPVFRPMRHAWRVEVAWLQVACSATTLRHLSRERARQRPVALAA